MTHIVIRADASVLIGSGHIMRCLTLAYALKSTSAATIKVTFISQKLPLYLKDKIIKEGFDSIEINLSKHSTNEWTQITDAQACQQALSNLPVVDLLIQDHYQLNQPWQLALKPFYRKILVIDDLANRPHDANYLLDQTFARQRQHYKSLVNDNCQLLIGHPFTLLRAEFSEFRPKAIKKRLQTKNIENILVSLGGMDPDNITLKLMSSIIQLKALNIITSHLQLHLVMSSAAIHLSDIQEFIQEHSWITLHINSENMAKLMVNADIAIGGSGSTAWERCCLGLPTLSIEIAENQALVSNNLSQHGVIINLGTIKVLTPERIISSLTTLINTPEVYQKMSEKCFQVSDGKGASRVVSVLAGNISFQKATIDDCRLTFNWQSDPRVRQYFKNKNTPSWSEHYNWFKLNIQDKNSTLYMLKHEKTCVGSIRLDRYMNSSKKNKQYYISLLISPEHQGNGFALAALLQLPVLVEKADFFADIHKDNLASKHVFLKAGFVEISAQHYCLKTNINNGNR